MSQRTLNMARVWPFIYGLMIPFSVYHGYGMVRSAIGKPGGIVEPMVAVCFIGAFVAPTLIVAHAISYSRKKAFQRPTWDRHFFGWWTDPLQPLRICVWWSGASAIGVACAYSSADDSGRMIGLVLAAIFAGLLLGEQMAYAVFRKRIEEKK